MNWQNYFKWLANTYEIEINQKLQNSIEEHFGYNLNIYTEQDMYEQSLKIIHSYSDIYRKAIFVKYKYL